MAEQPIIVQAPSGKSKCKACRYLGTGDPIIEQGSHRVGIPGHAAGGVTVYHWCHPICFAQHCLRIDHAPTGRAICKADGSGIAKGSLRLLIGYKKESTIYKVQNATRTIVPQLLSLAGRGNVTIHGLDELSLDERTIAERAVFGGGGGIAASASKQQKRCAAAPGDSEPNTSKRARPAKAKPAAKKKAPQARGEDEDEGELCD